MIQRRSKWGEVCFSLKTATRLQVSSCPVHTAGDMPTLDAVYARMPIRNFSSGLLARASEHVAVVEGEGILWSDWGRAERIVDTWSRLGRQPAFPLNLLTDMSRSQSSVSRPTNAPLELALHC